MAEQDRLRAERNLADTEYLAREIAGLRLALQDVATRDFVRSELRDMLEDLRAEIAADAAKARARTRTPPGTPKDILRPTNVL